jgi:ABC-type transporter Mla subunit MlaD
MQLMADGLLFATAMIAALYCLVLSRRLRRLTDSGAGIGSQIAALDRALAETRAALAETRDRVAELRASARAAVAELRRGTEAGEQVAARLDEGTARAEAALQRLYEADARLEAHDSRRAEQPRAQDDGEADEGGTGRTVVLETRPVEDAAGAARRANGAAQAGVAEGKGGKPAGKGLRT